jgi:hypothetical protein
MQTALTFLDQLSRRTHTDLVVLAFVFGTMTGAVGGGVIGYSVGLAMGYNQTPMGSCLALLKR